MQKNSQSIDSKIRSRIYGNGKGWVFTPKHFQDLGSSAAIESTLRRLKAEGIIRQLARGLYDFPAGDPVLGTVAPSADAIARALVVRDASPSNPPAHMQPTYWDSPSRCQHASSSSLTALPAKSRSVDGKSTFNTPPRATWPRLGARAVRSFKLFVTSGRIR